MYEKQVWEDRQVEFPMTFTMTQNDNGTITLTPYPGVVSNEGTKFTAARMNNIENGIANGVVPTGCILPFCGNNAPQGWLLCDGSAINRTTYADLFAILGTNYGEGDNSTTFNLPDMRGKVAVGLNTNGAFDALGKSVGEETHKLTINEMPSHDLWCIEQELQDLYYKEVATDMVLLQKTKMMSTMLMMLLTQVETKLIIIFNLH